MLGGFRHTTVNHFSFLSCRKASRKLTYLHSRTFSVYLASFRILMFVIHAEGKNCLMVTLLNNTILFAVPSLR